MRKRIEVFKSITILIVLSFTGCITTTQNSQNSRSGDDGSLTKEKSSTLSKEEKRELKELEEVLWESLYKNEYSEKDSELKEFVKDYESKKHNSIAGVYRVKGLASFAKNDNLDTFDDLFKALTNDYKGPYSGILASFISNETLYNNRKYRDFIKLLEEAVTDIETPNWLKKEYNFIIHNYYYSKKGDQKKSDLIKEELNIVSDWEIIGPFSNVSSSGFKKDYLMIDGDSETGLTEVPLGINNWKIEPFKPEIKNKALVTPISRYFGSEDFISIYAYKEIKIKEDGLYEFTFSRKGSLEIWLDNEKLFEENSDTMGDNSLYFKRELKKGEHSLLIKSNKLTSSTYFNASFSKIKGSKLYKRSTLYKELFPEAVHFDPLINEICLQIEADNNVKEGYFWLSYALLDRGWLNQARKINNLIGKYNESGDYYHWFDSIIDRISGDIPLFDKKVMDLAEKSDPFAPALHYAGVNYIRMGRYVKANEFISEIKEKDKDWYYALYLDLLLNLRLGNEESSIDIYDRIKELYPGIPDADLSMLIYSESMTKDQVKKYIEELSAYGKYATALYQKYLYASGSNKKAAIKRYINKYPLNIDMWLDYITLLYNDSETTYKDVKKLSKKAQKTFPLSYRLLNIVKNQSKSTYGNLNAYYTGNKSQFSKENKSTKDFKEEMRQEKLYYKESLEKILNYYPYSLEVRDELRELNGKKEFLKELKKRDSYDLIREFEESNFDYDHADAVIVYDNQHEISFGDGAATYIRHYILKVLNPTGIENNRFINLGFNPSWGNNQIYEAFTLKKDGTRIGADNAGYELAFSRLSPGDYIVVSYRTDNYKDGMLNREIFTKVSLASLYPIFRKDVHLIYPKSYDLKFQYNNTNEDDVNKDSDIFLDDFDITSFRIKKRQPIKVDHFTPNWRDSVPNVEISTIDSWDKILQWYKPLYIGQTIPTRDVKTKALELCEGAESRDEKIKRIFNYVANKIEYEDLSFQYDGFIPQTADSVLKEGYGDCKDQSVLLISLLKAVGIESHMTLNATYFNGKNPFIPSNIFDHVIVAVKNGDDVLYLDPTLTYYTFGEMPEDRRGTYLLDITDGGGFHKADYDIQSQKSYSLLELSTINKNVKIKGSLIYQGSSAWSIRTMFKDLDKRSKEKQFSQMMNFTLPGFNLESLNIENTDDIIYDPKIDFSGSMPSLLTKVDKTLFKINAPWKDYVFSNFNYWLGIEENNREVGIPATSVATPQTQVLVIDVPNGYRVHTIPENRMLKFKDSYINYTYQYQKGKIICTRDMFIPQQVVESDQIPKFKEFIQEALHSEKEDIYIRL